MAKPTQIKSISVENVRGISLRKHVFETPDMLGNKFHLLVAPNGYGKSSLAAAFDSLIQRRLKIDSSLLHKDDEAKRPKLEISYIEDGVEKTLKADDNCNEISKVFSIAVINSKLKPRAVAKTGFNQFVKPTASLIMEPITLADKVPNRPGNGFAAAELKQAFGAAGKILPNIQEFLENDLLLGHLLSLPDIGKFRQKKVWKLIEPIVAAINGQTGIVTKLITWIEQQKLQDLKAIPELSAIAEIFIKFSQFNEVERFLIAYQFAKAYADNAKALKEHHAWRSYLARKKRCIDLLASVNSNPEWIKVSVKETKGQLIAEFPVATKMSNGQRDLLVFVAQLMKAEFVLTGERAILLVDEVFDYLDECNLLAAQFYVTRFIDRFKANGAEIFPLFLTHLNPDVFEHSHLGLGKGDIRKIHLLDKATDSSRTVGIAVMVCQREDAELKPFIGKHFFHYHPENCDQVALFKKNKLKEKWGKSHDFYTYVFAEFKKYRAGADDADFVAACVAARIAIEKHAFDQLEPTDKTKFTDEFDQGTVGKLNFAEQRGIEVPDSHRLLGLLYNEMLHHKKQFDYISSIVSKMKNPAIRGMLSELPVPTAF
jgi:hypothetical protein